MSKEIPTPLSLLNQIARSDGYVGELAGVKVDSLNADERVALRARAIGRGATALAVEHTTDSGYIDTEGQFYSLISTLQPFLEANKSIDQAVNDGTYARNNYLEEVGKTIDFNTALRTVIDHNFQLPRTNLQHFLESTFITSYGSKDSEYFAQLVKRHLTGMMHEVGFEQIINEIEGVTDYRTATKEEDLQGIDMIVTYNGREIPLDIKSNKDRAEAVNAARSAYRDRSTYAIWSGLRSDSFTDTFALKNGIAQQRATVVEDQFNYLIEAGYSRAA